ncbi:MAG TPA: SemiSWEET family transporter [archaeon]|nr:SemiSWEET family transporter [archaeon]
MLLEFFAYLTGLFGILMAFGHFFQANRIYKNKSSKDVSLVNYIILMVGCWVWLIYGILKQDYPIMISFGISVVGTTAVVALKFVYK